MTGNFSGKLVDQPYADSMTNMSNKDQTDRDARSLSDIDKAAEEEQMRKVPFIQPAPPLCNGNPRCGVCLNCRPIKPLYSD